MQTNVYMGSDELALSLRVTNQLEIPGFLRRKRREPAIDEKRKGKLLRFEREKTKRNDGN